MPTCVSQLFGCCAMLGCCPNQVAHPATRNCSTACRTCVDSFGSFAACSTYLTLDCSPCKARGRGRRAQAAASASAAVQVNGQTQSLQRLKQLSSCLDALRTTPANATSRSHRRKHWRRGLFGFTGNNHTNHTTNNRTKRPTRRPTKRPTKHPTTRRPTSRPTKPRCHAGKSCGICLRESRRCTERSCNAACPSHVLKQTAPACSSSSVHIGDWCEGDGECGTNSTLNNCPGGYDVYQRISPSGALRAPAVA